MRERSLAGVSRECDPSCTPRAALGRAHRGIRSALVQTVVLRVRRLHATEAEVGREGLRERAGRERSYRTSLFITGKGESHVEQMIQPIYSRWRDAVPPISTTILAAMGQIELHLTVREEDEGRARARRAWPGEGRAGRACHARAEARRDRR